MKRLKKPSLVNNTVGKLQAQGQLPVHHEDTWKYSFNANELLYHRKYRPGEIRTDHNPAAALTAINTNATDLTWATGSAFQNYEG